MGYYWFEYRKIPSALDLQTWLNITGLLFTGYEGLCILFI